MLFECYNNIDLLKGGFYMKKTENFENYQRQMEIKQNIALLIEALQVLKRPGETNSIESSRYQIDIAQTLLSTLFDDLQDYIIQNGINIDLNSTFIEGFYEALKEQDDDIMASRKTLNRYNNIAYRQRLCRRNCRIDCFGQNTDGTKKRDHGTYSL